MGLDPRVDDQWTAAPPVLLVDERIDSFDVGRGIGPGECDPEEVSKIPRRELAVIDDHDQGERTDWIIGPEASAERANLVRARYELRSLDREDPRQNQAGMGKTVGEPHSGAELDRELPAPRAGGGHHDLRPLVQPVPRIIEGVDGGPRLPDADHHRHPRLFGARAEPGVEGRDGRRRPEAPGAPGRAPLRNAAPRRFFPSPPGSAGDPRGPGTEVRTWLGPDLHILPKLRDR